MVLMHQISLSSSTAVFLKGFVYVISETATNTSSSCTSFLQLTMNYIQVKLETTSLITNMSCQYRNTSSLICKLVHYDKKTQQICRQTHTGFIHCHLHQSKHEKSQTRPSCMNKITAQTYSNTH